MLDGLLTQLGLALGIGLVVGLERGWRQRDMAAGTRVAGLRTYGLIGLLGGVAGALVEATDAPLLLAVALLALTGVFAWFQAREMEESKGFSVTAVVAAMLVFAFGGLAVLGEPVAAAAGGVAVAVVLASREVLHAFLQRLTWPEVRSALLLLVMTAIVLPLLPNEAVDPWGGINPWEIWFFTVLIATISFGGYVAVRLLGPTRGILVSGLVGAVVSSTAVTVAFARRAKTETAVGNLAGGAALAAMISALRVVVVILLVQPGVLGTMAAPTLAGAAVFGIAGWWLLRRRADGPTPEETKLGNPFDLLPLAIFAIAFAVISGASAAAAEYLGTGSVILTAGFSGLFDVDVATLSAARLAGNQVPMETAGQAILLAVALNALARVGIAAAIGSRRFSIPLAVATAAAIAVGASVALATGAL